MRSWRTGPSQPWQAAGLTTQPGFATNGAYPAPGPYAPAQPPFAMPHPGFMPPTQPMFVQPPAGPPPASMGMPVAMPPPGPPPPAYYYGVPSPTGMARGDLGGGVDHSRMSVADGSYHAAQ